MYKDITGERFGRLIVIDAVGKDQNRNTLWKCKCDCGNETIVAAYRLTSGRTKSCGCISKEQISQLGINSGKNLINKKYGKLLVVERVHIGKVVYWKCLCDCGNIILTRTNYLLSGHTQSCGCDSSHGNLSIREYLHELNISYISEYSFADLVSSKNKMLRFDFAIVDKNKNLVGLIEYQGIQHYEPRNHFGGAYGFKKIQENDKLKKEYCKSKGIPLLLIKYNDDIKDKINNFLKGELWEHITY